MAVVVSPNVEAHGVLNPIEIKKTSNPGTELTKVFSLLDKASVPRGKGAIVCMKPKVGVVDFIAQQQACIQIATAIYTQACLRTSLFCFLLYQLSLWWVKYRAQPEAIST